MKKALGLQYSSSKKNFSVQGKSLLIKTVFSKKAHSHVVSSAEYAACHLQDVASIIILALAT